MKIKEPVSNCLIGKKRRLVIKSWAKINWFLQIGPLREDGYHEIKTIMQKISYGDQIEITFSSGRERDLITCHNYPIPTNQDSLFGKCLQEMRQNYPWLNGYSLWINLEKRVPPGSGLGGGSSNIGSILRAINSLFKKINQEGILKVASRLGSDVPFFSLDYPFSLVGGKGEKITPLFYPPREELVIVHPPFSVDTRWAYQAWDERKKEKEVNFKREEQLEIYLKSGGRGDIKSLIHNDFENLVFGRYPVLADLKKELERSGCEPVFMSGSGSSLVGIASDQEKAWGIVEHFRRRGLRARFCFTINSSLPPFLEKEGF